MTFKSPLGTLNLTELNWIEWVQRKIAMLLQVAQSKFGPELYRNADSKKTSLNWIREKWPFLWLLSNLAMNVVDNSVHRRVCLCKQLATHMSVFNAVALDATSGHAAPNTDQMDGIILNWWRSASPQLLLHKQAAGACTSGQTPCGDPPAPFLSESKQRLRFSPERRVMAACRPSLSRPPPSSLQSAHQRRILNRTSLLPHQPRKSKHCRSLRSSIVIHRPDKYLIPSKDTFC